MATDKEIKAASWAIAFDEWPLALDQERKDWADTHLDKWEQTAKSALTAAEQVRASDPSEEEIASIIDGVESSPIQTLQLRRARAVISRLKQ